MVIHEYLEGHESYLDLAMKYDIPSSTTVETWIKKYNRLEVIKDYKNDLTIKHRIILDNKR